MNAITSLSEHGYGASALRTAQDAEYDNFSRVTRMLRQSDRTGQGAQSIQAIHKNNELWTILAADLADPGNMLPNETKAGLLSLAGFVLRQGHAILSGKGTTDMLVDINLSIMKGLRSEGAA